MEIRRPDGATETADSKGDGAAGIFVDQPAGMAAVAPVRPADAHSDVSIDGGPVFDLDPQRGAEISPAGQHVLDENERDCVVDVVHHVEVGESKRPRTELEPVWRSGSL